MFLQFFAKHFITMTKFRNRIEKHRITQLCMEITLLVLLLYIPQYVEKLHPNSNEASNMRLISFTHVQDFPYMKALCSSHNTFCLIFFEKLANLHEVYVPYYNNLELVINLSNPRPHI
jgi:hypothetical protein